MTASQNTSGDTEIHREPLLITHTPFNNIGLAFSGGGYRAAAFTMGALSYLQNITLDEKALLRRVSYISSASGGSITSAMYALSVAEGDDFNSFYKKLFENLEEVKVLEKVFKNLNDPAAWKDCPKKRRNIINAFALAFDQMLFDSKTVNHLKGKGEGGHLDEVCFNTTEFYRGLLFRQAIKLKPDHFDDSTFLYGNYIIHLKNDAENVLRLADLVAASSCFPAGFEPILFPDEFIYNDQNGDDKRTIVNNLCVQPQEVNWAELKLLYYEKDIEALLSGTAKPIDLKKFAEALKRLPLREDFKAGFMDGGITDNQGIESIMRANDRRIKKETQFNSFDLMFICDVGSHFMDPYVPQKAKTYKGFSGLSINCLIFFSILILAGAVTSLFLDSLVLKSTGLILLFLSAGFLLFIIFLKKFIARKTSDGKGLDLSKNFSPEIVRLLFHHFGSTPIGAIADMLKERVNSVILLNIDIFLKRVRQLLYKQFLDEGHRTFTMKTNHVYDLSFSNDLNRLNSNDPTSLQPSFDMQVVAEHAFSTGTALWFDTEKPPDNSLAALIACGQFTTCYNLAVYIDRLKMPGGTKPSHFSTLSAEWQDRINLLEQQLKEDYGKFKEDPFWLYNNMGVSCRINVFHKATISNFKVPLPKFKNLRN